MTTRVSPKLPQSGSEPYFNTHYLKDTEYVVRVAKILLTPIGIWPRSGDSASTSSLAFRIYHAVIFCLMLFLLTPHCTWSWFVADNVRKLMKIFGAQIFSFLAVFKFWAFIIKKKEIRHCLEVMENDYQEVESEDDRQIMIKNAKIGRFFTVAYLGLIYGGALPYHMVMPLLEPLVVRSDNTTMIPLPYPSEYVFFVVEFAPLYQIFFATQMFISTLILSVNTGANSLIACVVMHSCCLFEVTSNKLVKWRKNWTPIAGQPLDHVHWMRLRKIVNFHVQALQYAETIEKTLTIVMLVEMSGCTLIICLLEYGILLDIEDAYWLGTFVYAMLITSIFVNVFILSFVGDKIKEQSDLIGASAYSIDWLELPKEVILKDLKFIMARANQPMRLTAGKLFDLSLQGFCNVAKTSMVYLNFLRTLEIT